MKTIIAALTVVVASAVFADSGYVSTTNEADVVKETIGNALRRLEFQQSEDIVDQEIVNQVYCEGTNSSFIVRHELTATQKRFIALGRKYYQLLVYAQLLESRLKVLEERAASEDHEREVRRASIRVRQEVRKAVEKASRANKKGAK